MEYICRKYETMKNYDKPRPRITIECDMTLTNEQYSKVRRVVNMLESNDFDVVVGNIVSESMLLRKTA